MLRKKLFAEFLGTGTLVATVVGSGIMATDISADIGIQLLINTIATVFVLYSLA
jgi:glycerol uptake facilitator-like aquaporin